MTVNNEIGTIQPISEIAEIFMGDEKNFLSGVARDGVVEIIPDIERDRRYVPIATSARSAVAAPLTAGKLILGVIVLEDNRTNAYRTFRKGDEGAWTAKVVGADAAPACTATRRGGRCSAAAAEGEGTDQQEGEHAHGRLRTRLAARRETQQRRR